MSELKIKSKIMLPVNLKKKSEKVVDNKKITIFEQVIKER